MTQPLWTLDGVADDVVARSLSDPQRAAAVEACGGRDGIPHERLDRGVRLAARSLRTEAAAIALVAPDDLYIKSVFGLLPQVEAACRGVVAAGVPVLLEDLGFAGVPLVHGDHIVGVLCVVARTPRSWTRADVELLLEIRDVIGLLAAPESDASRCRTLLAEQRETMRKLTASFLGKPPELPGWDVAALYQSAHEPDRMGGDFYDFIPRAGNEMVFVLGDICGRGVAAAVHTARLLCLLHGCVREHREPSRILEALNLGLLPELASESVFATLFLGILDSGSGRLRYTCAGHVPPILCRPGEELPDRLEVTGSVLGVVADGAFESREVELTPGSSLVLITDGIVEATHSLSGESSLVRRLGRSRRRTASRVAYDVMEYARQQSRGQLADDAAVVVLQRR